MGDVIATPRRRAVAALLAAVMAVLGLAACRADSTGQTVATPAASSQASVDPVSGLPWVEESALPAQAAHTLAEIRSGGPYDYPRNDDVVYHNNNRVLPKKSDGYYREYTVKTPGSKTRGARRIIRGRDGELYYTADHYTSFQRIREGA